MSNVNCIRKNDTDYMYEDTAGRDFINAEEVDLTSASKLYAKGELFWHENTLYKATTAITSGSEIVIGTGAGTNAVATTVSEELKPVASGDINAQINTKLTGKLFDTATIESDNETVIFTGVDVTKSYMLIANLPDDYDGPAIGMANIKVTSAGTPPVYTYTYTVTNGYANLTFDLIEIG